MNFIIHDEDSKLRWAAQEQALVAACAATEGKEIGEANIGLMEAVMEHSLTEIDVSERLESAIMRAIALSHEMGVSSE